MNASRFRWPALVAAGLLGLAIGAFAVQPLLGRADSKTVPLTTGAARYTVVFTEGTNLCVTDNQKHTVYFYTTDHGKQPGSDLKLRATVDLTQVGKDTIKPTLSSKEK